MRSLEWADPAGTPPPPVFLHDSRITEVRCEKNAVTFCFADGFSLVENGRLRDVFRLPAVGLFRLARHWASVPLRLAAAWEGDTARSAGPALFRPSRFYRALRRDVFPRPHALARRTLSPAKAPLAENELLYRHRDHGLLPDDVFLGRAVTFLCRIIDAKKLTDRIRELFAL